MIIMMNQTTIHIADMAVHMATMMILLMRHLKVTRKIIGTLVNEACA